MSILADKLAGGQGHAGCERQLHRRQSIASAATRHALNGPPQEPVGVPKLSLRSDRWQALSLNILFVTWSAIIGTRGFQTFFVLTPHAVVAELVDALA